MTDLVSDINRLAREPKKRGTLEDVPDPDAIGESVSAGYEEDESTQTTGGGIASPLVENNNERTYHGMLKYLTSSDGLFVLEYQDIASTVFTDNNGETVEVSYDDPDA